MKSNGVNHDLSWRVEEVMAVNLKSQNWLLNVKRIETIKDHLMVAVQACFTSIVFIVIGFSFNTVVVAVLNSSGVAIVVIFWFLVA